MGPRTEDQPPPRHLTAGSHLAPEDGACLMEVVSAVAGEPWSDSPAGTLPVLAHLARLVNDTMSPGGRQALLPLAGRLAGLTSADPARTPEVAALVTGRALEVRPTLLLAWLDRSAGRHLALARRLPGGGRVNRLRHRAWLHGPAQRAVEAAVTALVRHARGDTALRDTLLADLLTRAVTHVEEREGRRPAAPPAPRSERVRSPRTGSRAR